MSVSSVSAMASSWALLAATWRRMSKDSLSILAAGIAFQTFFSLFPTLTAVVSLYGLVADRGMVERQIEAVQGVLPPEADPADVAEVRDSIRLAFVAALQHLPARQRLRRHDRVVSDDAFVRCGVTDACTLALQSPTTIPADR